MSKTFPLFRITRFSSTRTRELEITLSSRQQIRVGLSTQTSIVCNTNNLHCQLNLLVTNWRFGRSRYKTLANRNEQTSL